MPIALYLLGTAAVGAVCISIPTVLHHLGTSDSQPVRGARPDWTGADFDSYQVLAAMGEPNPAARVTEARAGRLDSTDVAAQRTVRGRAMTTNIRALARRAGRLITQTTGLSLEISRRQIVLRPVPRRSCPQCHGAGGRWVGGPFPEMDACACWADRPVRAVQLRRTPRPSHPDFDRPF